MEEGSLCLTYAATPRSQAYMDEGQKQSDLIIVSSGKRLVEYGTPVCPLFRKADIQHNIIVFVLIVYIDLVFCFLAQVERQYMKELHTQGTSTLYQLYSDSMCS